MHACLRPRRAAALAPLSWADAPIDGARAAGPALHGGRARLRHSQRSTRDGWAMLFVAAERIGAPPPRRFPFCSRLRARAPSGLDGTRAPQCSLLVRTPRDFHSARPAAQSYTRPRCLPGVADGSSIETECGYVKHSCPDVRLRSGAARRSERGPGGLSAGGPPRSGGGEKREGRGAGPGTYFLHCKRLASPSGAFPKPLSLPQPTRPPASVSAPPSHRRSPQPSDARGPRRPAA